MPTPVSKTNPPTEHFANGGVVGKGFAKKKEGYLPSLRLNTFIVFKLLNRVYLQAKVLLIFCP